MTTVINTPPGNTGGDSSAGWVVAVVLILVVLVGGVILYQNGVFRSSVPKDAIINVTIPNPVTPAPTTGGTNPQ